MLKLHGNPTIHVSPTATASANAGDGAVAAGNHSRPKPFGPLLLLLAIGVLIAIIANNAAQNASRHIQITNVPVATAVATQPAPTAVVAAPQIVVTPVVTVSRPISAQGMRVDPSVFIFALISVAILALTAGLALDAITTEAAARAASERQRRSIEDAIVQTIARADEKLERTPVEVSSDGER